MNGRTGKSGILVGLCAAPWGLGAMLLAGGLILIAGTAWAGEEGLIDGVLHVRNAATPANGIETLQLKELWRLGGDDDEVFFGVVARVLADDEGNLYLLDTQLSEVQVYSSSGEHLRTLGHEGEGPGEIRRPNDFFFTPEGHVAMLQAFPGKVVIVDREGNPAGGFTLGGADPSQGGFAVLIGGRCRGEAVLMTGIRMTFSAEGTNRQDFFLARIGPEGAELNRYASKEYQISFADFVLDEAGMDFVWGGRWDFNRQGRVFIAPERNRYRIEVLGMDGTLQRVVEREYESWKRSAEEERQARLLLEAVASQYPAPPRELTTLDTEPDISGMHCASDGELWVRTSRGDQSRSEGIFTTFDVFDESGHFVRQLALAGPGDPLEDALFLVGDDRAVLVTQALEAFRTMQGVSDEESDDAGETPMEVIYYALER